MKLRNKKTGEIVEANDFNIMSDYNSLAELNGEWEDAPEEPKTFFTIYYDGTISEFKDGDDEQIRDMKSIGNYFETKEEAELAVRKLKAWKRLKDKGFRFNGWSGTKVGSNISYIGEIYYEGWADDMDLLFGGEE